MSSGTPGPKSESERILGEYQERDRIHRGQAASGLDARWSWSDPAYVAWMQDLEWKVLSTVRALNVDLKASRVLDVGCGGGYFSSRLAQYGARDVAGIDLVPDRVEQARRAYGAVTFVVGDAGAMPFDGGSFDLIVQFMCLSSVLDVEARAAIGSEMRRVARPGAAVVSFDIVPRPKLRAIARLMVSRRGDYRTPIEPVGVGELEALVHGVALDMRPVGFPEELAMAVRYAGPFARLFANRFPVRSHAVVGLRLS